MITFVYQLSKQAEDAEYIRTGKRNTNPYSRDLYMTVDDEQLTPGQRAIIVQVNKSIQATPFPWQGGICLKRYSYKPAQASAFGPIFGGIKEAMIEFDQVPSLDDIFNALIQALEEHAAAKTAHAADEPNYQQMLVEHARKIQARREANEQAFREQQIKNEAARLALTVVPWDETNTAVFNLYRAIFAVADLEPDIRFTSWIKRVDSVDFNEQGGYCFVGQWVNNHKVVLYNGEQRVYLAAATTGSRRHQKITYKVVVLQSDGQLRLTNIEAVSEPWTINGHNDPSWALSIRDRVAALLGKEQ